ncbi:ABC transporter substrate-binding protein [Kribbella shirazensis]|uniref:Multiple sugar transport system substrate-binding protein n=1 Tax=Kribbella shirazensis TaxID=1105143 RepID=A0A7X6A0E5_9ACTN|nr:extracellular solute-binding protein [Kribbella shirazensis]NIK57096.1 multiple sugar transport system substrate-binding protein [Kribbella shirazensis]
MNEPTHLSRRDLFWLTAVAAAAAACGDAGEDTGPPEATVPAPSPTFTGPNAKLSGDLKILLWSHFVPSHDKWFDPFAKNWGKEVGVNVTVDHINNTEIVARTAAEIQARQGHDLIQYIAPLSQFEPSVVDLKDVAEEAANRFGEQLELCVKSSQNPATGKHYAYSPGWVPDPGDYRKSLWESVGLPDGPTSWEDLLRGGAEIKKAKNIQMGLGMSQEIDSNMAGRALMWSYGASIQNEDEQVVINSPETVAAVEFMQRLFKDTMTNEVFSWNPASNNQGLIAGQMSYILNSISAWRTAQEANPEVADDIYFTRALKGPEDSLAAQHVMYNWIVPSHARNVDAAKEFLLHYTANWPSATYHSKLYDLPAFPRLVPQLNGWLDRDPFGAKPENKLGVLKNAIEWSTNIGHPGPANTAEGEVFATFVIPNMFAKAARGELNPEQAVADAERQIKPIFDKWRKRGLVGGA